MSHVLERLRLQIMKTENVIEYDESRLKELSERSYFGCRLCARMATRRKSNLVHSTTFMYCDDCFLKEHEYPEVENRLDHAIRVREYETSLDRNREKLAELRRVLGELETDI